MEQKEERSHTTITNQDLGLMEEFIAFRTAPVAVSNSKVRMAVNILSDDASTKTYINSDVADQLKLKGIRKQVAVNVLNNQVKTFETLHVEPNLEILNEKSSKSYLHTQMIGLREIWE